MFQFLIGAIGSWMSSSMIGYKCCFNSSLVRLEVAAEMSFETGASVSIPHWCDWKAFALGCMASGIISFNSSLVRLEVLIWRHDRDFESVSIPHWCDWKVLISEISSPATAFQFLIGAIGRCIDF